MWVEWHVFSSEHSICVCICVLSLALRGSCSVVLVVVHTLTHHHSLYQQSVVTKQTPTRVRVRASSVTHNAGHTGKTSKDITLEPTAQHDTTYSMKTLGQGQAQILT